MAMVRFRIGLACLASVVSAGLLPIALTGGGVEPAAAAPPTCAFPAPVGGVITLTGDCDTTATLTIPNGVTLNGAGHTITAHDVTPGTPSIDGAVLTNAAGATSMSIENLTIMGNFTPGVPGCRGTLNGISFNGAGGSVTNVTVTGISEHSSNCQVGRAIVATGTAGQTLTITSTTVTDYQKSAIQATGMTMNVSGSFIGPPTSGIPIGQNGLLYLDGSTGTTSGSTIYGSGFGSAANANAAVLMLSATNVTLRGDTITGDKNRPRRGHAGRRHRTQHRRDHRPQSDRTDRPRRARRFRLRSGGGSPSTATVTCNTFSGWKTDFDAE